MAFPGNRAHVANTMLNGRVLMRGRKVTSVDEGKVLADAARETETMLERTGLSPLLETPATFWGHSHY